MVTAETPRGSGALNLAHWGVTEGVNGPGRRFTVWVQGCPHRCAGCFNPGLQPAVRKTALAPADLAGRYAAAAPTDGITLSGGEPFAQAAGLADFLDRAVPRNGPPAASVIAFSGYTLAELEGGPAEWRRLLAWVDLLVDGPYRAEVGATDPLTGSGNQRLIALTETGAALEAELGRGAAPTVAVHIAADGEVVVSGFPPLQLLGALRRRL